MDEFYSGTHGCLKEYYEIDPFIEPFKKYKNLVDSQINILEKRSDTVEDEIQEQRIEERIRLLEIDSDDLDYFVDDDYGYDDF